MHTDYLNPHSLDKHLLSDMLEFLSLYPTSATALHSLKHLDKNPLFVEAHFIHLTVPQHEFIS